MNKSTPLSPKSDAYARRFNLVFDHIDKHLDEPLGLEELSRVANFSRFHFQRQFSEYCGMTPGRYIQLMRLKRASYRLVFNPLLRIVDIALDAGYANAESFSRSFKIAFDQTPSGFRRNPDWAHWSAQCQLPVRERMEKMEVTIVDTETTLVAALEHRGSPALVNASVSRFIAWRKSSGESPVRASKTFGIAYDDPQTTPADEYRFDICGSIAKPVAENSYGVITKEIPGGRCAVVRHTGARDQLGDSVRYFFKHWLPDSGEEMRDFQVYFHYLNLSSDMPEHELQTDIYLPLK